MQHSIARIRIRPEESSEFLIGPAAGFNAATVRVLQRFFASFRKHILRFGDSWRIRLV
jgi:hypothetical protein